MSDFKSTLHSYDYYLTDGLFKNLVIPDGLDRDTLIYCIMSECGEMQPVWTDPEFMQEMIGAWSKKWAHTFERWLKALETDYAPLNNYDRYEDVDEEHDNNIKSDSSSKSKNTVDTSKSAYDSQMYQPYDNVSTNGSMDDSSKSNDAGTFKRRAHMYGNIGVTTSQQMLEAEYDVAKWNIYEHIKDLFMQDFCIMIY